MVSLVFIMGRKMGIVISNLAECVRLADKQRKHKQPQAIYDRTALGAGQLHPNEKPEPKTRGFHWGERWELNPRPPVPQTGALTN